MSSNTRSRFAARASGRALMIALAVATAAHAGGSSTKAQLTAYRESAGWEAIAQGDYAGTVSQLAPHGALFWSDRVAASTNLCVAYIMSHQWDAAHPACDTAISLAYSNRAVLSWLEAQPHSAASDMSQARELSPSSDFVEHNIAVLGTRKSAANTVAEAR